MHWYPPDVEPVCYLFSADKSSLPDNPLLMPTVGNGNLATVVYRDRLFLNGLYNGADKKSHRAAIPAHNRITVKPIEHVESSEYCLDTIAGSFTHVQASATVRVTHRIYAHRTQVSIMVNDICIERLSGNEDITVDLDVGTEFVSPDLAMVEDEESNTVRRYHGSIYTKETTNSTQPANVYIITSSVPKTIKLIGTESCSHVCYLTSVDVDEKVCHQKFQEALALLNTRALYSTHVDGWIDIWKESRIDCWGSTSLSRTIYGCFYYLYSSLRMYELYEMSVPFYGLSPESLAYGDMSEDDYLGHVFWDQETWMYPPILLFWPEVAARLLQGRCRVVEQATVNAEMAGYQGMKFPWEQGTTGVPTSPSDDCENYEVHINADISLALRQYWYATGLMPQCFKELATGIGNFWKSRMTWDDAIGQYVIKGVMPPDEWHYPVDNSCYTNAAAALAVSLPEEIHVTDQDFQYRQFKCNSSIEKKPDLYIPFDSAVQYHPEFDGYTLDAGKESKVKQADVVMLGYPLDIVQEEVVRKHDLELYESVTTTNGPAMTWSMFCIGHLELDQPQKADQMFSRQLLQATEPFQVWSEYPGGSGAINFITGMGGFLQSVTNGYLGIRLRKDGLHLRPSLPPSTHRLQCIGLSYLGSKINVDISHRGMQFVLMVQGKCKLVLQDNKLKHLLDAQKPVCVNSTTARLVIRAAD